MKIIGYSKYKYNNDDLFDVYCYRSDKRSIDINHSLNLEEFESFKLESQNFIEVGDKGSYDYHVYIDFSVLDENDYNIVIVPNDCLGAVGDQL